MTCRRGAVAALSQEAMSVALNLASEQLAPETLAAVEALQRALDCPVDIWARDSECGWHPVALGEHRPFDFDDEDDAKLDLLMDKAFAAQQAFSTPTRENRAALVAPIVNAAGDVRNMAVANVEQSVGSYAARLADAVLRELSQRQEMEWLRDENFVFSHQVTDDFEELTFLRTMATRLIVDDTTLNINAIVDRTIGDLREMIGAETVYFVTAPHDRELSIAKCCPAGPDVDAPVEAPTILRLARVHRARAAHAPCVKNDLTACDPEACAAGVRQFLMAPICVGERHFGWFVAVNRTTIGRKWAPSPLLQLGHDEFGTWEASLLSTAATLLASHASNLDLIREKEQLLVNTVRSLVTALDAKDAYTRGHSERVALFSKRIAETLGYDAASAERLYLTGLLHDVGKIGVSDAVLRKPDKLTDEEFAEIKRHPDEGWSILRDLQQMRYVLPGVLHHHERVDGRGYPDNLVAEKIPLDARIMAVADAYDAMTSDRAYRAGMPHETAIKIIREGAGTQWDAQCVDAFLSVIEDIIAIRYGYKQMDREPRTESALEPWCQTPE
jgi:HD-GYP domain-containing protein (c-di-GMP phosphodiesterase class II)